MHLDQPLKGECPKTFTSSNFGGSLLVGEDSADSSGEDNVAEQNYLPDDLQDLSSVHDVAHKEPEHNFPIPPSMEDQDLSSLLGENLNEVLPEDCLDVSRKFLEGLMHNWESILCITVV